MTLAPRIFRWLAAASIATLAAVAVLLSAAPASAVDLPFAVSSPAEGSTTATRSPVFTGSGFEGAIVTVTPAAGQAAAVATTVLPDGSWTTLPVAFGATATAPQQVTITHTIGGVTDTATVNFVLPPVAAAGAIVITSPSSGTTLASSSLVVQGTAPVGSVLSYWDPESSGDGAPATLTVDTSGAFELTFLIPYANDVVLDFEIEGVTSTGLPLTPATLSFSPARLLAAPTIASPASGSSISGSSVTFRGTGIPGRSVVVSAYVPNLPLPQFTDYSRVSPTVVVDARGNWSATIALLPASYTAFASLVEESGGAGFVISEFSPQITFSLAAAAAPTAPAELAATGFDTGTTLSSSLALLTMGTGLMVARRRVTRSAR
jgi:hypothetical protein